MSKKHIMVEISLLEYLRDIEKKYGPCYVTVTKGGKVYVSDEAPGDISDEDTFIKTSFTLEREYIDKDYIEFDQSDFYMKLSKEIASYINVAKGSSNTLKNVIADIKKQEKELNEKS